MVFGFACVGVQGQKQPSVSKINNVWLLIERKPWLELIMWKLPFHFFILAGSLTPSGVALHWTIAQRLGEGCALRSRWRSEAKRMRSQNCDAGAPGERKAALLSISPPPASRSGPVPWMGAVLFSPLSGMSKSSNKEREKNRWRFLEGQKVNPRVFLSGVCSNNSSTCC